MNKLSQKYLDIARTVTDPSNGLSSTLAIKHIELEKVLGDCRAYDWDGYKADPVLDGTFEHAHRWLDALPGDVMPCVDFGAEPDGCVTFEWYNAPEVLSVSIMPDGALVWAQSGKESGRFPADPSYRWPSDLALRIRKVIWLVQPQTV